MLIAAFRGVVVRAQALTVESTVRIQVPTKFSAGGMDVTTTTHSASTSLSICVGC